MQQLMLWSYRHPLLAIIFLLGITLFFAYYIPTISVDVSARTLWSKGDPAKAEYEDTIDKFGSDKITVIYVKDRDLFTPDLLARLSDFQSELEDLYEVDRVDSLFSVSNMKGEEGFLNTEPFLEDVPETVEKAQAIKVDALRNPIVVNNLISSDGSAMTFNLFLDEDISPEAETDFSHQVDEVIATIEPYVDEVFQLGTPYTTRMVYEGQMRDQRTVLPLSFALFALTSFVIWRSASLLGMTIITSGLSILWTMGFMGLFRIPMNAFTAIIPALLVVVGSTEDVHLFSEYLAGVRETGKRSDAIPFMIRKTSIALFLTALTTFLGFLAIALNKIVILQQFGFASAFGLLANPFITFLVAPVYLKYLGPQQVSFSTGPASEFMNRVFTGLAGKITTLIRSYRWQTFIVLVGGTLLIGLFTFRITIDNDLMGFFRSSSPIRQYSQQLHEELAGGQTFVIHVSSGVEDTFKHAENLTQIADIQAFLRQTDWCDLTTSIVDYLKLTNREMHDGDGTYERIPETPELTAQYLLIMPSDEIEKFITYDASEVCIVIRHNISSSHRLKEVVNQMRDFIAQHLNPHFDYRITGESILSMTAANTLASGQVFSLSFTLVVVFLLMSLLFVNIKAGALALVPNILPIVLLLGLMGGLGIFLNTATSMVAVIAIGIAVDDTIHFMTRYNKEMRDLQNQGKAIEACIHYELRPIVATSVGLTLGFGVIMLSNMLPLAHFGFLAAAVMLFALIMDLFITPILLSSTQLLTLWDMLTLNLQQPVIQDSPLFQNLKRWQIKKIVLLGKVRHARSGESIVQYGEQGHSMYLLLEGCVTIEAKNEQTGELILVNSLDPGDVFGELALINPGPRSANIHAIGDTMYLELDWKSMERIRRIYPRIAAYLYRNLAHILGQRLKDTTQKIII